MGEPKTQSSTEDAVITEAEGSQSGRPQRGRGLRRDREAMLRP